MTTVDDRAERLSNSSIEFDFRPATDQSFENALVKARTDTRLTVADGIELLTTGTEATGIDHERKGRVLK